MARTWLSITVELIEGRGRHLWPRRARVFVAARSRTFAQLAEAINAPFARWDRAHLHEFHIPDLAESTGGYERVAIPDSVWDMDEVTLVEVLTVMRDRARFHATAGPTAMDDRVSLGDESLSALPWTIVALLY